jgi:hypothetical protein
MAMAKRPMVEITASWGNDDAFSTIRIRRSVWCKIKEGAYHERGSYSWYEGTRYSCYWVFSDGLVSISGSDGADHLLAEPIEELMVEEGD